MIFLNALWNQLYIFDPNVLFVFFCWSTTSKMRSTSTSYDHFRLLFWIIADTFAFACWFLMVAYKDQIKLSTVILQLRKTYRPDSSSTRDAYICISWLASMEVIWIPMCVSIGLSAVICSFFSPCLPTLSPLDSMRNNWFWSMHESGK